MTKREIIGLFSVICLSACAGDELQPWRDAPPKLDSGELCVLSADCPAGLHCDLGECVQDCNAADPCAQELHCSARARCLEEGASDADPPPAGEFRAPLEIQPAFVRLPSDARSFTLSLTSESSAPVRFRTTSQEEFLHSRVPRGRFEGKGEVTFDLSANDARVERAFAIRFFTDLGERVVQVVQPAGIAGNYQGSMRYLSQGVDLGEARLALSLWNAEGALRVAIDPDTSLLFPAAADEVVVGTGNQDSETSFDFSVQQALPADFGGARNHFARPLLRRLSAHLELGEFGIWEGEFRDQWFGLTARSVELEGRLSLYPRGGELPVRPENSGPVGLPEVEPLPLDPSDLLAGSSWTTCQQVIGAAGTLPKERRAMLGQLLERFYGLAGSVERRFSEGKTYVDLFETCANEYRAPTLPGQQQLACGHLAMLGCAALEASGTEENVEDFPDLFAAFVEASVAPPLLMAQQHAVWAIERSLVPGGLAAERGEYELAIERMAPVLDWLLKPQLLGYLRRSAAAGDEFSDHSALGALARLLELQTQLDGERTRLTALATQESAQELVRSAQSRALLGLLEVAIVLDAGAPSPSTERLSSALGGYHNPLDSAFGALLEGARAFGLPEGFVPFVYRAFEPGNNFEQMLGLAQEARQNEVNREDAYLANQRIYEASEQALLQHALDLQGTYELQLTSLCGADFVVSEAEPIDWQSCGAASGEIQALLLEVQRADEVLRAGVARLAGMRDKMAIDLGALSQRQKVRSDTLEFIGRSNGQINALSLTEKMLDVALQAIEIAANSSLWNGGAPAAMSAVSVIIGAQKAGIEISKQQLAQAQDMAFLRQDGRLELISGMAEIKKQTIDIGQLALELSQDALAKLETVSRAKTLLEQAQALARLEQRALEVLERDPSRDPTFRIVRDQQALALLDARMRAQRLLFLAGRALEYEVNTPIAGLGSAVMNARSQLALAALSSCLSEIHTSHRVAFGSPQRYSTDVSVREMLGIDGPRKDEVTGEEISAGAQFRQLTQQNSGFDEQGNLVLIFATNLQPDNGLWASDVCADRISGVQAQLVGDGLGDAEAQVNLSLDGGAVVRDCGSDDLLSWSMGDGSGAGRGLAIVQAGVNSFGLTEPNRSLFGHSVARATWRLVIPSAGQAPQNADVNLAQLDDVVLRIEHQAVPRRDTPLFVDTSCLSSID